MGVAAAAETGTAAVGVAPTGTSSVTVQRTTHQPTAATVTKVSPKKATRGRYLPGRPRPPSADSRSGVRLIPFGVIS